jgi:hypothetical protein
MMEEMATSRETAGNLLTGKKRVKTEEILF